MAKLAISILVAVTAINIAVAYYVVNQPLTEINNYRTYDDAVKRCEVPTDEPFGVSI